MLEYEIVKTIPSTSIPLAMEEGAKQVSEWSAHNPAVSIITISQSVIQFDNSRWQIYFTIWYHRY